MRAVFRPQFWLDLEDEVADLTANASVETARRWHDEVMTTVTRVERQPDIGRRRRDLDPPDIRTLMLRRFPRYLLFYRWTGDALEILENQTRHDGPTFAVCPGTSNPCELK